MKAKVIPVIKNFRSGQFLAPALGAFAIGAATGSILALLYAPTSGKVTRKRIGMQLGQLRKTVSKKALLLKDAANDKIGETRQWLVNRVINSNGKRPHRATVHA